MREIMERLLTIQKLELGATSLKLEHEAENLIYLPENEPLGLTESPPPVKVPAKARARRTRQKLDLHVA